MEARMSVSEPGNNRRSTVAMAVAAALAFVLLLAACGSDGETTETGAETPTESTVADSDAEVDAMNTLSGEITVQGADDSASAEVSRVVVRLEDVSLQDASSVVITERTYEGVETLPLAYELSYDATLEAGRDYAVSATVYGADGEATH